MQLEQFPVIAAVRTNAEFCDALKSPINTIFLLHADILTLESCIHTAHNTNKKLFVHLDMAEGIGKDKKGITYLKNSGIDGIISTRPNMIKAAKDEGLLTVMRFFAIDSRSIDTATENIRMSSPDMVEMMPGILPEIIEEFRSTNRVSVIAGGLIRNKNDIYRALSAGAIAISTGNRDLWNQ